MKKYFIQEILNRIFDENSNRLYFWNSNPNPIKYEKYSIQEILNRVFDEEKNRLRIK